MESCCLFSGDNTRFFHHIFLYFWYLFPDFYCLQYLIFFIYIYIRGEYDKFLDVFRMGNFIDSTHMKL